MTTSSSANRRLQILGKHLVLASDGCDEGVSTNPCSAAVRSLPRFDPYIMETYMDDLRELKRQVYDLFKYRPELLTPVEEGMTKEQHREQVRKQLRALLEEGINPLNFFDRDYKKYFYLAECLSLVDLSLMVKSGVQFSLWGGSVLNLGSEQHRRKYADDIAAFRLPGCFAMTELKHGSNVAALQTEAVLDVQSDEWVIHTPDEGAIKWWIGNAAEDGKSSTVFARLKLPAADGPGQGKLIDHGVHAFVVPLRDDSGKLMPGVEIHDCGYKVGLNGVDNGAIRFTHVRVPRENLLNRFATVDKSGRDSSPLTSEARRFAATLGELTGGRVGLTCGSAGVLKGAITIAIRYSAGRQQFGPPESPEVSVLDYQSQQEKLIPILSTAYALHFAKDTLVQQYCDMKRTKDARLVEEVHSFSAGLKAYTTSYTQDALSVCRESCGGHGYAAINRLGALRSDHDIFQTFEGDNTVLLQQVTAMLLKGYKAKFKGAPISSTVSYLKQYVAGVLPHNPLVTHETDVRHLRDPAFLRGALRYRTARLLFTLQLRIRHLRGTLGDFGAWNQCLSHILALARAHIEHIMLGSFQAAVEQCIDPDCRRALKAMSDLFALRCIETDMLFRNEELVAPAKAKAIQKLVLVLCSELRGVAVPLVNAFGVPDHILRAPIGLGATAGVDMYKEYLHAVGFEV